MVSAPHVSYACDTSNRPDIPQPENRTDWRTGQRPWTVGDLGIAVMTALLTAVITWISRSEIVSTDPWHYVMAALQFPQETWVPLGYTRYGMILPLGPLVLAWGNAPATFYAPALLASATLAASVYLVGRRFWGRIAGVTAVVLLLSNWLVFPNLSRFYPDIPSMALVLLALVLALAARDYLAVRSRCSDGLVVAAGFLLGWSFETRETALFAWPIVIVALWVRGRVLRNALLAAAPIILWAVVDMSIGSLAYGDPLLKLHTFTHQDLSAATKPSDVAVIDQFVGLPRADYLTMIPRLIIERGLPGGVWVLGLAAVALLGIAVRDTAVRLHTAAFVISYILFVGVSGFFLPSHPAGRLDVQRYWIQFVPWISLACAGVLHSVLGALAKVLPFARARYVAVTASALLVAGPIASIVPAVQSAPSLAPGGGLVLSEVSDALASLSPAPAASVYTDSATMRILPIYRRPAFGGKPMWTTPVRAITGPKKPRKGDFVLLVSAAKSSPCAFCNAALKRWRDAHDGVESAWKKVYASQGDGYVLYEVR